MDLKKCIFDLSSGLSKNEKKAIWLEYNLYKKHQIIHHVYLTVNVDLAELIMEFFFEDFIINNHNLLYTFINLLAITLASTHMVKYLKYIVRAKCLDDVFFYIDSNLLFEFSVKADRSTCIKDTIKNIDTLCKELPEELVDIFKQWIAHYSDNYDEKLVIEQWLKYETSKFKSYIEEKLNDIKYKNY